MVEAPPIDEARRLERRWAAVRGRMEAASGALGRQGSVAWRTTPGGTRVASVRYVEVVDGRRRQRALYLGGDVDLAERARDLIRQYRERERWAKQAEDAARFVAASGAILRRRPATRRRASARRGEAWAGRAPRVGGLGVEQGIGGFAKNDGPGGP